MIGSQPGPRSVAVNAAARRAILEDPDRRRNSSILTELIIGILIAVAIVGAFCLYLLTIS